MTAISQFNRKTILWVFLVFGFFLEATAQQVTRPKGLQIIMIRHAEKPIDGDNLSCAGLNRAMQLPKLLYKRFGVPSYVYVPSLSRGNATKHARMFQTIMPMAVKYNLTINSKFKVEEVSDLAKDILQKQGVVLIVWEHKALVPIAQALGVQQTDLKWKQNDYDSIWVINFDNGSATLAKEKEGLKPAGSCAF